MIKLRSAIAVLALSILLSPLAACSTSTGANGCDNKSKSGDMLKRLNSCETGWVETQRRDDRFVSRTVFKPSSGESCRVWLYPNTSQANRAAGYINATAELRNPAYYYLGRDPYSDVPFIATSQEMGTTCVKSMQVALGAQLGTKMQRLAPLASEQTSQDSPETDTPTPEPHSPSEDSTPSEVTKTPQAVKPSSPAVQPPVPEDSNQSLDNAYHIAAQDIGYQAFSRSGLISELVSGGYSKAIATAAVNQAVDKLNIDWNAQAGWKAGYILSISSEGQVSKNELIDQLISFGFTQAQAKFGAENSSITLMRYE